MMFCEFHEFTWFKGSQKMKTISKEVCRGGKQLFTLWRKKETTKYPNLGKWLNKLWSIQKPLWGLFNDMANCLWECLSVMADSYSRPIWETAAQTMLSSLPSFCRGEPKWPLRLLKHCLLTTTDWTKGSTWPMLNQSDTLVFELSFCLVPEYKSRSLANISTVETQSQVKWGSRNWDPCRGNQPQHRE